MARARSTLNQPSKSGVKAKSKVDKGKKNAVAGKPKVALKKNPPVVKPVHELIDEEEEDRRARSFNWSYAEKLTLFMHCNARKDVLRSPFKSCSGGVYLRQKAWEHIAEAVNKVSDTERTWENCKDKVARYCTQTKEKYRNLVLAQNTTGNGAIDQTLYLDSVQEMALDYIGQECVLGVPGVSGTAIVAVEDELPYERYVTGPWNPYRLTKPKYSKYVAPKSKA